MKTTSLIGLLATLTFTLARAQAPSGSFSYDIAADTGPLLWNITGVQLFDPPMATVAHQDGWGILWSNRWPIGRLYGDGSNTFVRASFHQSTWEQRYYPFGGIVDIQSGFLDLALDSSALALSGTQMLHQQRIQFGFWRRHVLDSTNETSDVSFPLTDGNDGSWNLQLNLTASGNFVRGDATITFANAETQGFRVNGKTSSFTGETKLLLTGSSFDRGSYLWVTLSPDPDFQIESLSGRVSGQKVVFP
jgi:hypothetical protein